MGSLQLRQRQEFICMEKATLNFERFELPFFNEAKDQQSPRSNLEILLSNLSNKSKDISEEDIEEEEDNDLVKENMESRIPNSAIYLGAAATELEHATTTWMTRDEYYIYPLKDDVYNWAVFRISWDDNWERWEWIPDGRIKGLETNYKEAARLILHDLWKQWGLDLNDSENESYLAILEQIK
jgi:hypothetical protein